VGDPHVENRIDRPGVPPAQEDPQPVPNDWPALASRAGWYPSYWLRLGAHVQSGRRIPSARSQELAWTWCAVRPMRRPELGNQMSDAYRVLIPAAGYKDTLVEQARTAAEEIDRLQVQHRLDEGALQEMSEHVRELDEWFREMGWSFVYGDPYRRAAQAVERFLRATVGLPGSSG